MATVWIFVNVFVIVDSTVTGPSNHRIDPHVRCGRRCWVLRLPARQAGTTRADPPVPPALGAPPPASPRQPSTDPLLAPVQLAAATVLAAFHSVHGSGGGSRHN